MVWVCKNKDDIAIVCYDESYAKSLGIPYASFDAIPENTQENAVLKTDLKKLWWEVIPDVPAPDIPLTPEEEIEHLKSENAKLKSDVAELQAAFDAMVEGVV